MSGQKDSSRELSTASSRRLYGLRSATIVALIGLLLISIPPIIAYTYWRDTRAILDVSGALISQLSDSVVDKTTARLWHGAKFAEMSAQFLSRRMRSITKDAEMESYLTSALKVHPSMASSYVADEQGNFLMVKRFPDRTLGTRIVDRTVQPARSTWKYSDLSGKVVQNEAPREDEYDPRARPWYQGAKESGKLHLTDMYVFFSDQKPGVTVSVPITDESRRLLGVFGIDIELSEISNLMRTLQVGKTGVVFITDKSYRLIAYPDFSRIVKTVHGEPELIRINELGIDWISAAFKEHLASGASRFAFECKGTRYMGSFTPFPEIFGNPWKIGVVVPEDDFVGSVKKTASLSLAITAAIFLASILAAIALAHNISAPILFLSAEAKRIKDFELDHEIDLRPSIREIFLLATALSSMKTGLKTFGKYVPMELVRQLVQTGEDARLGGKKKELTFFFSDIAGFTPISEGMSPESLMIHISEYMDELTNIIMGERGTVDKYIGDSIMAFWGAPIPDPDHPLHACNAALACQKKISELNEKWRREGRSALLTRIGIHTGEAIVGNVGSPERMNYTVLGDSVNLASRLEGANKIYGTRVIISQSVYERVSEGFLCRPLDVIAVKGKEKSIKIYELIERKADDVSARTTALCEAFARALDKYARQDWDGALTAFSGIHRDFPSDYPTALYIDRCKRFQQNPPETGWTTVTHLDSK